MTSDAQDAREVAWRDYFSEYDTSRVAFDAIYDAGVASERERVATLLEALELRWVKNEIQTVPVVFYALRALKVASE